MTFVIVVIPLQGGDIMGLRPPTLHENDLTPLWRQPFLNYGWLQRPGLEFGKHH